MSNALDSIKSLFDGGEYNELNALVNKGCVLCVYGKINGVNAYAFYLDNCAYNAANCKKIIKLYSLAVKTGSPIIGFYSSYGVDLNEGFEALIEYSELLNNTFSVSGVVPQISVITGECLGVAALMCNTADVVIALNSKDYYLASDSENTTDVSMKNGVVDIIVNNEAEAVENIRKLLNLLPQNNLSPLKTFDFAESGTLTDVNSFISLKSDYTDKVKTGLATVGGFPAGIIDFMGNELDIRAAYKAEHLIKLCNAYNIPIVTIADCKGFADCEASVLITAVTKLSSAYANATTSKISIITKECIGGAFAVLAGKGSNADVTVALDSAVISPMRISSAVAFMFDKRLAEGEDRNKLEEEFIKNNASAKTAAESGAIDFVVKEDALRKKLVESLEMLSSKRETTIPRKHTVK